MTSEMQVRFISAIDREYTEMMKEGPKNINEVRELHEMNSKIKDMILELE